MTEKHEHGIVRRTTQNADRAVELGGRRQVSRPTASNQDGARVLQATPLLPGAHEGAPGGIGAAERGRHRLPGGCMPPLAFAPCRVGFRPERDWSGFGIVADEAVGRRMFEAMPRLEPGQIQGLHLFPLERADYAPTSWWSRTKSKS